MLDKTIKELDLSPAAYILLISNGIKNISGLIMYSKDELLKLPFSSKKYESKDAKEKLVEEIITKLELYDLKLDTKTDRKPLSTEIRIKDLNLKNCLTRRLTNYGIVTLGSLSVLNEKNLLNMYRIGFKSLKEIKQAIEPTTSFNIEKEKMIKQDLSEEDIKYYARQKELLNIEELEYQNATKEKEANRNKLYNMKLKDLCISKPQLEEEFGFEDLTLIGLLKLPVKLILNRKEIMEEIKGLDIKGLYLGMSYPEILNLEVTKEDLEKLKIKALESRVRQLEEEIRILKGTTK